MKVTEAMWVIISRNGMPYEDDWDLCEAATVLAAYVSQKCKDEVAVAGQEAFRKLDVKVNEIVLEL